MVVLEVALGVVWLHILDGTGHKCLGIGGLIALSDLDLHIYAIFGRRLLDRLLGRLVGAVIIDIIVDFRIAFLVELHGLRHGIIVDELVFFVLLHLILVGIDRLVGIVVGDLELHLVEELRGIQDLADDEDRLSTQIREEGDGNQAQDGRETRRTHQILYRLADEQAVITARIEASILEEG